MHLHDRIVQAKQQAAPLPKEFYGGVPIVGDKVQVEAPHIIPLAHPEQLQEALDFYLSLNKWSTPENFDWAARQVRHEGQHFTAAEAVGAVAVTNELALFRKGRGPFTKHFYQVRTVPHGVEDPGALAVITAHPEELSPEDWRDLDEAGMSLADVSDIATQNHWPLPLSQQGHDKNHMPY
jgi:hypothetical protein